MDERLDYFNWTKKQWNKYEKGEIVVPLEVYERLVDAIGAWSRGQGLNKEGKQTLANLHTREQDRFNAAILEQVFGEGK